MSYVSFTHGAPVISHLEGSSVAQSLITIWCGGLGDKRIN